MVIVAGVGAQNRDWTLFSSATLVHSDTVIRNAVVKNFFLEVVPLGGGTGRRGGSRGVRRGDTMPGSAIITRTI